MNIFSEADLVSFDFYWFVSSSGEVQKAVKYHANEKHLKIDYIKKAHDAYIFRLKNKNVFVDNVAAQEALADINASVI
jgi:hypothetical protein